ncbi:MAG: metallophosphoesterase, partial [Spirochaetaceae bacterium]|nr:metallophosphoesterase [Spirochaetaceae bacterium]
MRILCVSDQVDPIVYSPRMRERFRDVTMVLCAGDLPGEYLDFICSMLNKSMIYVEGNHDSGAKARRGTAVPWESLARGGSAYGEGAVDAGFRLVREEGLIVLGLPGSMTYNNGPNQYSERAMSLRLALLVPQLLLNKLLHGRAVDLVLTHAPPRGIHDREDRCHRGFACFLWLMRAFKP